MTSAASNPLLQAWDTPYGLPPFPAVRPEHFEPAYEVAMREHLAEIETIAANPQPPDFDNTIAAFDRSGRLFARVANLFDNLAVSETSPALQAVELLLAPRVAAHSHRLYMHRGLFARIDALHAKRGELGLDAESLRTLERFHTDFVRAGAKLDAAAQRRYGQVMERLAELGTQFSQNVLADEAAFRLELRGEAELAGLPGFVRAAAKQAAIERGVHDAHVITLSRSLIVPFLSFSERRDLRETAWRALTSRGEHDGEHDNRGIVREMLALRLEQARAHGHASFADYAAADAMARTPAAVEQLLRQAWRPAKACVEKDRADLQALARERGDHFPIEAWDWRFYAEKLRQQRYRLDEAEIKPYFALDHMIEALFDCAQRLFGLRFVAQPGIDAYHPDVEVYEVRGAGDELVGVFLHDNFARPSKRSGAWMSSYRLQSRHGEGGARIVPIVVNNNNFAKAAPGEATLLSHDDARTLFHEFGHGLHGLLSDVGCERISGTNVLRDFVELPSQLFEHWLDEPQVLERHARHWRSGEPIPAELVAKLKAAEHFNQGFETARYVASAIVDMAAHALTGPVPEDIVAFEAAVLEAAGAPPGIGITHRLTHFQHLFSGAWYAAGYYVYLWAEVLEADGYQAFVEAGDPFDAAVAARLQRCVYAAGDSRDPSLAYVAFRGRAASIEPMLRKRGLVSEV